MGPDLANGVGAGGFRGSEKVSKSRGDRPHLKNAKGPRRAWWFGLGWGFGSGLFGGGWFSFGDRSGRGLGRTQESPATVENPSNG